jgi:hypothetical protein
MSAAIPREMSRIMAPRATSSRRLCRQFILPIALDLNLGSRTHRANSSRLARARQWGRGTAKPSGIRDVTQVLLTPGSHEAIQPRMAIFWIALLVRIA